MVNNLSHKINLACGISVGLFLIFIIIFGKKGRRKPEGFEKIMTGYSFAKGKIIKYRPNVRYGTYISYEFEIPNKFGNKKISGYISPAFSINMEKLKDLETKELPIIYSKQDVHTNVMLFTRSDFKDFGLSYPDSLKWVYSYIWSNSPQ